nr:putative cytokinin riboside 5'-monophosphate phosphoribohydrolase LOGL2 [Tanacetum cinerariifolium]
MLKNQKNFNGQNFKRWQQKMFLYPTTLNLARFLKETVPQVKPPKEGQPSITQVQDLQVLIHEIHAEGMNVSKTFQVAAIDEMLPLSWVDFKNNLKHKRKEMSVEDLIVRWFPAQSIKSSNVIALDSPYLLVLITGTSQSKQHVDTSLIHLEPRKSPTAELFDVDSGRISIHHYEY